MTNPTTTDPEPRAAAPRRLDWVHITDGVFLIGLGVFALLNASGRLPWTFWYDALAMWPILVISAGLRFAVERSRTPWLALLGPGAILTVLAFLASGRLEMMPGPWQPVAVPREQGIATLSLRMRLVSSRIDVTTKPVAESTVIEGRQSSREGRARVEVQREDAKVRVILGMDAHGIGAFMPGRTSRWEVDANQALPVKLDLEGAMVGARFDLTQGRLDQSSLRGVFNGIDLRLPRPDAPVKLELTGVFNAVDLYVPAGTPVRVHGPGFPLNILDRGQGDPNDADRPGYEVSFGGLFSRVGVTELP